MHTYFTTFAGYLFMAAILLVCGIYCFMYNFYYGYASFEQSINYVPFFFVFLIPVISAGVFTDEKRQKTEQLLYTLPYTSTQIVVGKYLALLSMLFIPLFVVGAYPLVMNMYGDVNLGSAYCNILIIFLLGAALLAICMFISSLTENIIVSAVVCFAINFVLYQMSNFEQALTESIKNSYLAFILIGIAFGIFIWFMTKNIYVAIIPTVIVVIVCTLLKNLGGTLLAGKINLVMNSVAIFTRITYFMSGIFDLTAVVFYLSIVILFVLFTIFTFERKRWN